MTLWTTLHFHMTQNDPETFWVRLFERKLDQTTKIPDLKLFYHSVKGCPSHSICYSMTKTEIESSQTNVKNKNKNKNNTLMFGAD